MDCVTFLSEPERVLSPVLIGSKAPLELWLELRKDSEKLRFVSFEGRKVCSHNGSELVTGARERVTLALPIIKNQTREHPESGGGKH